MKYYRVKPEYTEMWSITKESELVVSEAEIKTLAKEWDMTVEELKDQVEVLETEEAV